MYYRYRKENWTMHVPKAKLYLYAELVNTLRKDEAHP